MPFPTPWDRPDRGIKPGSLASQADSLPTEPAGNIFIYVYTDTESLFPLVVALSEVPLAFLVKPVW